MTFLDTNLQAETIHALLAATAFFLLGASTKYVDDAFDENAFSKTIASLMLPPMAALWGYLMSMSIPAAVILSGIILGALMSGKVNNIAFGTGFVIAALSFYLFGSFQTLEANIVPILIIGVTGTLDEILNDYAVERAGTFSTTVLSRSLEIFLKYRFLKRFTILTLVIVYSYPLIYFFLFLLQSVGYLIVGEIKERSRAIEAVA